VEADYSTSRYNREQRRIEGVGRDAISVTDTGLNLRYGSRSTLYQRLNDLRQHERVALSYITGTHNFKAGVDLNQFSQGEKSYDDPFLVCADFASYIAAQEQVSAAWQDKDAWTKMSILNTARSGKFSSDRAIAEYSDEIWNVWPLTVTM